jgi:magnesium transporter
MLTRHERNGMTWVDLESPTREELALVMAEFGIDDRIEDEIISPTPYPLVAVAPSYVYLILHFPTTDPRDGARSQEIDFVVGLDFLITVRYELVSTIHTLHRVFESETLVGASRCANPAEMLERLLRQLYGAVTEQVESVGRTLERIEGDIFSGRERATVRSISLASRVLLRFDIALSRHREPLGEFLAELGSDRFFGASFKVRADRIEAERAHAASISSSYRAVLVELRRTNDSLLSTSQNEVMKRLTIMAFVTFPLTLIAAVFGMNTSYLPIVGRAGDFWYIFALMISLTTCFFLFFKQKKWL